MPPVESEHQEGPFDGPSPFIDEKEHPRVAVAGGRSAYDNTRHALSFFDLAPACGARVLVKPNAGRLAPAGAGVTTEPMVVAAVLDAFLEAGAAVVNVGESPVTGVKTMEAFEQTGIAVVARQRGCALIDMDQRKPIMVPLPSGVATQSLSVCADLFDHDIIVSVPVMKMHMHTVATLSVKNMKGCLWRRSKVDLHMLPAIAGLNEKPLNVAIADMASVLRPHFSVIDGTVGMEGLGPSAGERREAEVVAAGVDPFAVDTVGCALMNLDVQRVPHLRIGGARGYGCIDRASIDCVGDSLGRFVQNFALAPDSISIKFPKVEVLDNNSCSACQSTVLLLLKKNLPELLDYFPKEHQLTVAIGKGNESVPPQTVCVGNCTARNKDTGIFVPGCPPVGSAILRAVSQFAAKRRP